MGLFGLVLWAGAWLRADPPAPAYEVFYSFTGGAGGAEPNGGLTLGRNGELYGITTKGGAYDGGTVFKIAPTGAFTTVYSFNPQEVGAPFAGLTEAKDGNLYGVTHSRATGTLLGGPDAGPDGPVGPLPPKLPDVPATVYRISNTGEYARVCSLDLEPAGRLTGSLDGNLYGASLYGSNLKGGIYRVSLSGAVTELHSFSGADGRDPDPGTIFGTGTNSFGAGLVERWAGEFVGLTRSGNQLGLGTLFQYSKYYGFATLHTFTADEGLFPGGGLLSGNDGMIYGTTNEGGAQHVGTVFRFTPGALTTLHSFSTTDGNGWYPESLTEGFDGSLYGTNSMGAATGTSFGTIFRLTKSGDFSTVHYFTEGTGRKANGRLVRGPDGNLYGMTSTGGAFGFGTLFRIRPTANNRLPVAVDDTSTMQGNFSQPTVPHMSVLRAATIDVLANDFDPDFAGEPTIIHVSTPAHGTAYMVNVAYLLAPIDGSRQPTSLVGYCPDGGFVGVDEFTYTITDHQGGSATATVRVTVLASDALVPPQPPAISRGRYTAIITPQGDRPPGYIRANVVSGGSFTGQVRMGSDLASFQGFFGTDRIATCDVDFPMLGPARLKLQLSSNGNFLSGSVEIDGGSSAFSAGTRPLMTFPKGEVAPRYTVLLLPASYPVIPHRGTGYALLRFSRSGIATVTGCAADGKAFSASTNIQPDGSLPIFAASPSSLLYGELRFASESDFSRCSGDLLWRTISLGSAEVSLGIVGATYDSSRASRRDFRDAQFTAKVEFPGSPVTASVRVSALGQIKAEQGNPPGFRLQFNQATGTFSGRVTDPATGVRLPIRGAVLQGMHRGAGFAGAVNVTLESR